MVRETHSKTVQNEPVCTVCMVYMRAYAHDWLVSKCARVCDAIVCVSSGESMGLCESVKECTKRVHITAQSYGCIQYTQTIVMSV